jgi:hypothetical protein
MKANRIAIAILAVSAAATHFSASAFSLGNPLAAVTGKSSAPAANPAEVLGNTREALLSFINAELGLSEALGGYEGLAAQQQLLANMKRGDAVASKSDFEALVNVHKSANDLIETKTKENAAIDAKNKSLAAKSMVEYVKGLVYTRKMVGSVQDLAKNPMSIVGDATTVLYVAKEVPTIAVGAASSTGSLMKYLGSNGVDMSEAKKSAGDMEK